MNSSLTNHTKNALQKQKRKKRWQKVLSVLAAVVVFVTTYMLILPAITLENNVVCGKEEHTHTEDCYTTKPETKELTCTLESLELHKHTSACYDAEGNLICGIADYVVHTHDDNCYDENGKLICALAETKEHQHTDSCYSEGELICAEQEVILHSHTDNCYDENGNLICGMLETKEHQHTDACFTISPAGKTLVCEKEEHQHNKECCEETENAVALLENEEPEAQTETTRADLKPYIGSDTNCTSAKYNPVTDQVEVSFHMTFGMNKTDIQAANYQYIYTLPEGVIIPDDMLGKTYEGRDSSGTKGFTYQFVKNGDGTYSVLVDFDKSYVDNQDNFNGYINFSAFAGEDAWKEGGGYEFKFNDDCIVTIPIDEIKQEDNESIHYNVAVDKSNSGYDATEKRIRYTITVDSTKGTPDPLNLTDILTAEGLEVDRVEIVSVTRINDRDQWGNPIYNNNIADETTLTEGDSSDKDCYEFSYDADNGITVTLPGLEKGDSGCGQKYTISYYVYLKEPAAGASYSVDNKVTVAGTDDSKGETVTDTAESSTTIDKTLTLQKSGSYDKETGKIKWTIKVNQNGNNIAGAILKDTMFEKSTITVSPDSGYSLSGSSITFSGVDGEVNNQTYTITYETDAPEVGADGTATVTNTAEITPPGGGTPIEDDAEVTIDKRMKMAKTGSYDKATDTITWTITVNENGNDIAGAELTDTMFSSVQVDSIEVSPNKEGMTIVGDESTGTIQKITFNALNDSTTNTQTYTITYTTPSEIDANSSGTVTNTATFDPSPGEEGGEITSGPGVWVDRTVDLDKSGGWYDSSTNRIFWSISINNNNNNIVGYELTDNMLDQLVEGTLVIKNGWQTVDINSTDNGFTINKDQDSKITSIIFTAIGDAGGNTNHYTIEYYTEATRGWESTTVTNTAILTPPGGTSIEDSVTSTIPADGSVYKKCKGATAPDDNKKIAITWRTEINIPEDGLPAGTVVTDTLANDQWMDWLQIQKWGSVLFAKQTPGSDYIQDINYWWPMGESYTILFYATDGSTCTYDDIVSNSNGAQNKQFTKYEITFPNGVPAGTYGGKTIYFEYESYADVTNVTDVATYKNTVSVTPPDSTSKSSDATYTYKAPGVVKMDGDGNTGTSSIVTTNGELTWRVRVRLGADCTTLTVTDTLPEGVTLTGLTFANQALTIDEDGVITGDLGSLTITEDSKVTTDNGIEQIKLKVTLSEEGTIPSYFKAQGEFYIVYTCKISDELLEKAQSSEDHKVGTFTNKVTVTANETSFPSSEQTQDVTYTKPTSGLDPVNKGGVWINDSRLLEYSMLLNPDGMDLLPGNDTLTLTDELSYYIGNPSERFDMALLPGSVKLYQAVQNEDGIWSRGQQVTDWTWSVATGIKYGNQSYSTISVTIPDGIPLILEYAYNVWVPEGSSFDDGNHTYNGLYNKATLEGVSGGFDENKLNVQWKDSETSAGITADRAYIFYKVEENSYGNRLPGAEFTLYDSTGNALFTYTTDANGSFVVQWQSESSGGYQDFIHNTLYYVQETKAPDGYLLPDEPTKYFFYFSDATDTEHTLDMTMLPENAVDLSVTTYTAYVENTKNTTEIVVDKQWFDPDGTTDITATKGGSISFDLYQVASTTPPSGSESGGSESGGGTNGISWSLTGNRSNEIPKIGTFAVGSVGDRIKILLNMKYSGLGWMNITWTGVSDGNGNWNGNTYEYTCTVTSKTISITVNDTVECLNTVECEVIEASTPDSGTDEEENTGDDTPVTPAGTVYDTYTISNTDGWTWSKNDLPLTGKDTDGNIVYYTYYVVEHNGTNYDAEYENNEGISSGTITIKNTESDTPAYELPETGGSGTIKYIMGGILLMLASVLLYIKQHIKEGRRRHIRR